jgi:hypothetical protein
MFSKENCLILIISLVVGYVLSYICMLINYGGFVAYVHLATLLSLITYISMSSSYSFFKKNRKDFYYVKN